MPSRSTVVGGGNDDRGDGAERAAVPGRQYRGTGGGNDDRGDSAERAAGVRWLQWQGGANV